MARWTGIDANHQVCREVSVGILTTRHTRNTPCYAVLLHNDGLHKYIYMDASCSSHIYQGVWVGRRGLTAPTHSAYNELADRSRPMDIVNPKSLDARHGHSLRKVIEISTTRGVQPTTVVYDAITVALSTRVH